MGLTPRQQGAHPTFKVDARPGPSGPPGWEDAEEPDYQKDHKHSFCSRFKFAIWVGTVAALVAAVVGLSIVMAVVTKDNKSPSSAPEGGGGGGSAGRGGNTGPLPVPPTAPFTVPSGSKAIWWDEFDGDSLDSSKWSYDLGNGDWGWGNNESEVYTNSASNVQVLDGLLKLTALKDGATYTSGRINTKQTASFYPGMQLEDGTSFSSVHVEARMQLPAPGQGLWPAFWLFPTDLVYGKWAASGEIDIMESVNDMITITQGLHFGAPDPHNAKSMTRTRQANKSPYSDGFHTFAVDWELGKLTLSVDGKVSKTFLPREKDPEAGYWTSHADGSASAPFDQPFYIIMNLAVGGMWPKYPDATTTFPATLAVDFVRVWGTPL